LTPAELRHAKRCLLDYVNATPQSLDDNVSITLSIEGDRTGYSADEQKHFVIQLLPSLSNAAAASIEQVSRGRISVTVTLGPEDAARLCRDFNERRLPAEVSALVLNTPSSPDLVVSPLYDEAKLGVSKQQAVDCVRSYDRAEFYDAGKQVEQDVATLGIFTKLVGKKKNQYTVIVIASFRAERVLHIFGAFRADHAKVGIPNPPKPLESLKAFLTVYGVDVDVPGLGNGSLFLGKRAKVPINVATEIDALKFWHTAIMGQQEREACAMISDVARSEVGSFMVVRIIVVYARDRYLRDIGRK
jgi:hypothetical protein